MCVCVCVCVCVCIDTHGVRAGCGTARVAAAGGRRGAARCGLVA